MMTESGVRSLDLIRPESGMPRGSGIGSASAGQREDRNAADRHGVGRRFAETIAQASRDRSARDRTHEANETKERERHHEKEKERDRHDGAGHAPAPGTMVAMPAAGAPPSPPEGRWEANARSAADDSGAPRDLAAAGAANIAAPADEGSSSAGGDATAGASVQGMCAEPGGASPDEGDTVATSEAGATKSGARSVASAQRPGSSGAKSGSVPVTDNSTLTADAAQPSQAGTVKGASGDGQAGDESAVSPAGARQALSDFAGRLAQAVAGDTSPQPGAGLSAGAAPQLQSAVPPVHVSAVGVPLGDPVFPGYLAGETASLVMAGIENAEITLQPRELGPVRIEISLNGEVASIAFSATQPDTRQAIEQSLPVLKEMLAEHGLLLSDASVSDGRAGPGDGQPDRGSQSAAGSAKPDLGGAGHGQVARGSAFEGASRPGARARGLLDLYA